MSAPPLRYVSQQINKIIKSRGVKRVDYSFFENSGFLFFLYFGNKRNNEPAAIKPVVPLRAARNFLPKGRKFRPKPGRLSAPGLFLFFAEGGAQGSYRFSRSRFIFRPRRLSVAPQIAAFRIQLLPPFKNQQKAAAAFSKNRARRRFYI